MGSFEKLSYTSGFNIAVLAVFVVGIGASTYALINFKTKSSSPQEKSEQNYFASVPHFSEEGLALASGDFDGDGYSDTIVGTVHGNKAEIYGINTSLLNTYDPDTRLPFASGPQKIAEVPYSSGGRLALTTGDFDGDKDLDFMVAAGYNNSTDLYLFYNDGKGNLTPYIPPQPLN